jgi:hypothetical protein
MEGKEHDMFSERTSRGFKLASLLLATLALGACVGPQVLEEPPAATVPPLPDTRVYVYPTAGQSDAQMERDRYECHVWAVKQTGFDPSSPQVAPHQRVQVIAGPPPGANAVAGAATGAILGAAVSRPRDAGAGLLLGAVAGAIIGSAADNARAQQAAALERRADNQPYYDLDQQATNYRRALSACLQGRQYSIK